MNFGALDWAIVLTYLVGSAVFGFWAHRYARRVDDFLIAGRAVNTGLAVASLCATGVGIVTLVYFAEQGYQKGFSAFALGLIAAASMTTLGLTGFAIKRFRATGAITIAEYYEMLYGKFVHWCGGLVIANSSYLCPTWRGERRGGGQITRFRQRTTCRSGASGCGQIA